VEDYILQWMDKVWQRITSGGHPIIDSLGERIGKHCITSTNNYFVLEGNLFHLNPTSDDTNTEQVDRTGSSNII